MQWFEDRLITLGQIELFTLLKYINSSFIIFTVLYLCSRPALGWKVISLELGGKWLLLSKMWKSFQSKSAVGLCHCWVHNSALLSLMHLARVSRIFTQLALFCSPKFYLMHFLLTLPGSDKELFSLGTFSGTITVFLIHMRWH